MLEKILHLLSGGLPFEEVAAQIPDGMSLLFDCIVGTLAEPWDDHSQRACMNLSHACRQGLLQQPAGDEGVDLGRGYQSGAGDVEGLCLSSVEIAAYVLAARDHQKSDRIRTGWGPFFGS